MRAMTFVRFGSIGFGLLLSVACTAGAPVAPTSAPAAATPAAPAVTAVPSPKPAVAASPAAPAAAPPVAPAAQAPAVSGPPMKVNLAYNLTDLQHLPLQIARDQKLFQKYGLDPQITEMEGGTEMSKVLIAGKVDFISSNLTEVADAHVAGEDERLIADPYDAPTDGFFVTSQIKGKDELKGKKVGISRFGGASELTARLLLRKLGLDDTKDVTIVQVGGESARVKAALAGTIDAIPADASTRRILERQGLRMIDTLADPDSPGGNSHGLIAMGSYLKQNPEAVRRMLMAYSEGVWILAKKPEVARESIQKMANTTDAEEVADIQALFAPLQRIPALADEAKVAYTLKLLEPQNAAASKLKPSDLYDNSFLEALVKEGFFEKLGR